MHKLQTALASRFADDLPPLLAEVLDLALRQMTIAFDAIREVDETGSEDLLLFAWNNKLLIPRAFSRCGEWDDRILLLEPGEVYQMPNISRVLVQVAKETGHWDIRLAVLELYREMGEPLWQKMPDLVQNLAELSAHGTIVASSIHTACVQTGITDKTGAMIAILKGGGVISPRLAAMRPLNKAKGPVYEVNPNIYPKSPGARMAPV